MSGNPFNFVLILYQLTVQPVQDPLRSILQLAQSTALSTALEDVQPLRHTCLILAVPFRQ